MLISPTKKRLDELHAQLRELRSRSVQLAPALTEEEQAIHDEIQALAEQLDVEQNGRPAIIRG